MSEQDEWIVVKPKRKQIKKIQHIDEKKLSKIVTSGKPLYLAHNEDADIQQFINSPSFKHNYQLLKQRIQDLTKKRNILRIHIECLGLGNFMLHAKPRYQFMFLKKLLIPVCQTISASKLTINCYDPVFCGDCLQEISKLGTNIGDNIPPEKQDELIILYMPHCERFLHERYCEVYNKKKVLVIGNSIREYRERCQLIGQDVPQCLLVDTDEVKVKDFKESINDTFCYYI